MPALSEVILGPAAKRAVLKLRRLEDWSGLLDALRQELTGSPSAAGEDKAGNDPGSPARIPCTVTALSSAGYIAVHRPMTGEELHQLQRDVGHPVASQGFYVLDLLPAHASPAAEIYLTHYGPLMRLAALLTRDHATAEDVVAGAFTATHEAWPRLQNKDQALSFLRQAILQRSRSLR